MIVIFAGILLALYVIGLINPFTGALFQYPYYRVFCGHEPVVGTSFMGKDYKTSDMKTYKVDGFDQQLFCTEDEARAHNYRKSLAP